MRSIPELTTHVGKEANHLEEVEAGIEHDSDEVYAEYPDPQRDPWRALVLPVLRDVPAATLAAATGLHPRSVPAVRNGHRAPHPRTRAVLARAAADFARCRLGERGVLPPADGLAACAAYLWLRG